MTTIRIGLRVEIYGPLPIDALYDITRCLLKWYPESELSASDPFINLLTTIYLDPKPKQRNTGRIMP